LAPLNRLLREGLNPPRAYRILCMFRTDPHTGRETARLFESLNTSSSNQKRTMKTEASYPAEISFPTWQPEVQAAVNEPETEKLLERVHAAEIAIFNRLQELAKDSVPASSVKGEREALSSAMKTLLSLKRDRLGFPDWMGES